MTLPKEVISLVIPHLRRSSLVSFSLVCKRFRELALPTLWQHLDLGKRDPEQLESLFGELFEHSGTFEGFHFQQVSLQMLEELAEVDLPDLDLGSESSLEQNKGSETIGLTVQNGGKDDEDEIPELLKGQILVDKCLNAAQSIGTLNFEICLMDNVSVSAFEDVFMPTLEHTLGLVESKVSKFKVSIDCFSVGPQNGPYEISAQDKVVRILSAMTPGSIDSLCITGAHMDQSFQTTAAAVLPQLWSLSLQSICGHFPCSFATSLRKLHVAWTDVDAGPDADNLRAALQLAAVSSNTLESLGIRSAAPLQFDTLDSGLQVTLPKLRTLEITDDEKGMGVVISSLLAHLAMPGLQLLGLDTSDIASVDLTALPTAIPSLRLVKLSGVSLSGKPASTDTQAQISRTFETFEREGVDLRLAYDCLRCDDSASLTQELATIRLLASHVVALSLSCCECAASDLDKLPLISLPRLTELSFSLTDMDANAASPSRATVSDLPVKLVLGALYAPAVTDLQVTVLLRGSDSPIVQDLCDLLEAGKFPCLQNAGGMILLNGSSSGEMQAQDDKLREICYRLGVESSSLRIMSRNQFPGSAYEAAVDDEQEDKGDDEDGEWTDVEDEVQLENDVEWEGMGQIAEGTLPAFVQDFLAGLGGALLEDECGCHQEHEHDHEHEGHQSRFEELDEGHEHHQTRGPFVVEVDACSVNSWISAEDAGDRIVEL